MLPGKTRRFLQDKQRRISAWFSAADVITATDAYHQTNSSGTIDMQMSQVYKGPETVHQVNEVRHDLGRLPPSRTLMAHPLRRPLIHAIKRLIRAAGRTHPRFRSPQGKGLSTAMMSSACGVIHVHSSRSSSSGWHSYLIQSIHKVSSVYPHVFWQTK